MIIVGYTDMLPGVEPFGSVSSEQAFTERNLPAGYPDMASYIHVYPLSGGYEEALFFLVDFKIPDLGLSVAALKLYDTESFTSSYDNDYNSQISHFLFLV